MHYESDKNANYVSQTKTDNVVRDKLTPWERVVKARDKSETYRFRLYKWVN